MSNRNEDEGKNQEMHNIILEEHGKNERISIGGSE
jgi:hypothetical protein